MTFSRGVGVLKNGIYQTIERKEIKWNITKILMICRTVLEMFFRCYSVFSVFAGYSWGIYSLSRPVGYDLCQSASDLLGTAARPFNMVVEEVGWQGVLLEELHHRGPEWPVENVLLKCAFVVADHQGVVFHEDSGRDRIPIKPAN